MLGFSALFFVVLGTVRGCSPPDGGYVEPTEAQTVFYADYVVTGRVTKIISPDPVMVYDSTYGAEVQLSCQYKGGNIPKIITIIGAGFIPGHCTAKELKLNNEYILFLSKRSNDYFEQTSAARNTTEIKRFLQVCDLMLKYPVGTNVDFPSVRCQAPAMSTNCERYDPAKDTPASVAPPSPPPKPMTHSPEHVENVQMPEKDAAQKGQMTTTPSGSETIHFFSLLLASAIGIQALVFV